MVKRYDCLKILYPLVDENMLTATSLSSNSGIWSSLREQKGYDFYAWNMGLCVPFSLGLSTAFPRRKVIAMDSDGSLMVDTSSLITVADLNPPNLVILVFDNESYARMGSTATSRVANLEKIAQGAGIKKTGTIRTPEEFSAQVKQALSETGPHFFVVKVEAERERFPNVPGRRNTGRPMKERFVDAVRQHPDYQKWR